MRSTPRILLACVCAGSLTSALFSAQCGGDGGSGDRVVPGIDGAALGDGASGSLLDGAPARESDQVFHCKSSQLERCASTTSSDTCGSSRKCSGTDVCPSVSCACGGGGTTFISGADRCKDGCCMEVTDFCRVSCASVDAGPDAAPRDASVFDAAPALEAKRPPSCGTWETLSTCQGEAICDAYNPDAGCAPVYSADCKPQPASVLAEGSCRGEAATVKTYPWSCAPELDVVSVYERDGRPDPPEIPVDVERTNVPIVLALNSFQSARWIVRVKPGVTLTKIVVVGNASDIIAPDGVPIVFFQQIFCSYDPSLPEFADCNDRKLLRGVEGLTGLHASSWVGCYYGVSFKIR